MRLKKKKKCRLNCSGILNLFDRKTAETAPSTMTFYRDSLAKFLQFLGKRSDDPITDVTKQDVVAFRNSLITQVSAKTANHDLKAKTAEAGTISK
jgi:site-specific recombinase XerD